MSVAPYCMQVLNGTVGTQWIESIDFYDFVPGQTLWLSEYYMANRITGTNHLTLTCEIEWWNGAGGLLTSTTTTVDINGSVAWNFDEHPHLVPATAARGRAKFTLAPVGGTFQHDVSITGIQLNKHQRGADVTYLNGAVGDGNRVVNSRMEATTFGYAKLTDVSGVAGTPFYGLDGGTQKTYAGISGTFTAASQTVGFGTAGNTGTPGIPFRIRVQGNERLYVGAKMYVSAPAGSTWSLNVYFFDNSNAVIGSGSSIITGSGNVAFPTLKDGFCTAPSNATWAIIEAYLTSGTTGAFVLDLSECMVCTAGALQTTSPQFSPGPSTTHSGPGGNLLGDVDANGRPNIDLIGTGHQNRANLFNAPNNLVYNGNFRLVDASNTAIGWASTPGGASPGVFVTQPNLGENRYVYIPGSTTGVYILFSDLIPVFNTSYTVQCEMYAAGLTAGQMYVDLQWYASDGTTLLYDGGGPSANGGSGWTKYSSVQPFPYPGTIGTAPSYVRVRLVIDGPATVAGGSLVAWRKIKLAAGNLTTGETPFDDSYTNSHTVLRSTHPQSRGSDRALIDFAQSHSFRGSVPPTVPNVSFSYSSTSSSVTISWATMTIYRADGTTVTVSSGSQVITGLSASTTYKVYPYVADSGGTTGTVSFVSSGGVTPVGTPAICFPAAGDPHAAANMYLAGNIPLTGFQVTTPASGSGGGGGGGSSCLHPDMLVGGVEAEQLTVGSLVPSPDGPVPVKYLMRKPHSEWVVVYSNGAELARVTPDHRLHRASGAEVRAQDLRLGDLLATAGDHVEVTGLELDTVEADLVCIELANPHLYYAGPMDLLCHNPKP